MSNAHTPAMMAQSMAESLLRENKALKEQNAELQGRLSYALAGEKEAMRCTDHFKDQNALLTVQVPEGWKLVPVEILKNIYMLIDPPPIEVDGKMMVFKNPKAADTLAKISAEVRALLDSTAPAALPQQVKSEDARDALITIARGDARNVATADQCSHGKYGYEDCELCICDFAEAAISAQENKL